MTTPPTDIDTEKMVEQLVDTDKMLEQLFELTGGPQQYFDSIDKHLEEFNNRWKQNDTDTMGRVLRGHLFVEHYMTLYLQTANPNLGDLDAAQISFAKKLLLVGESDVFLKFLVPGVTRLNKIRNRLAHNLSAPVTTDDVASFRSVTVYWAMREAGETHFEEKRSLDPLDVYDHFAMFAANAFNNVASPVSKHWEKAFNDNLKV